MADVRSGDLLSPDKVKELQAMLGLHLAAAEEAEPDPGRQYQPTPYDVGITDDPDLTWAQARAEAEAGLEAEL